MADYLIETFTCNELSTGNYLLSQIYCISGGSCYEVTNIRFKEGAKGLRINLNGIEGAKCPPRNWMPSDLNHKYKDGSIFTLEQALEENQRLMYAVKKKLKKWYKYH